MVQKELLIRLGKVIAIFRKEKKLSQALLADKVGCTRESLSEIENGKRNFSVKKLGKIAKKLNRQISDLFKTAEELIL